MSILDELARRREEAFNYFQSQGWSPEQAAGILGNLQQESNLRPNAVGDNGTAFGIAQWRGPRRQGLETFAKGAGSDPGDFSTQLQFIQNELMGPESRAGQALKAAQSIPDAVKAFIGFERPQGWSAANPLAGLGSADRLASAQSLLGGAQSMAPAALGAQAAAPALAQGAGAATAGATGAAAAANPMLAIPMLLAQALSQSGEASEQEQAAMTAANDAETRKRQEWARLNGWGV